MSLWAACGLTVALETAFLALVGYRSPAFLGLCVCVNAATNLTLNLLLAPLSGVVDITFVIYLLEAAAVWVEYRVYSLIAGKGLRLFLLTLCANCLSYTAGVLIFGHV